MILNHMGGWLKGFQRKLRIANSLVAELWGIRDRLVLNPKRFVMVVEETTIDRPLMPLISYCRKLLLEYKIFKISHVYREPNELADLFAKETVNIEEQSVTLLHPPLNVLSIFRRDSSSIVKTRLVTSS